MNQKIIRFPEFKSELCDVAKCYLTSSDKAEIWRLCEKGILFDIFQEYGDRGKHLNVYFEKIREVIGRRQSTSDQLGTGLVLSGRYLLFDPSATMYDGLAEELSSGFFDSDDAPPPEFWVGIKDDLLVSFVPSDFIGSAAEGIDSCMSGCIEWSGESFTVTI